MKEQHTLTVTTPTDREVVMTRVFDAPRALVFEAMTQADLLRRWLLGPPGWAMVVCEVDYRVGGTFRYSWAHENGATMGMRGTYREILPPERSVHVESMDGFPGESLVTGVFVERGGKTTLTTTVLYASKEMRDAILKSGMERGVAASYDRLEQVVASMRAPERT